MVRAEAEAGGVPVCRKGLYMCDCVQRVLSRALCVIVSVPSASECECECKCNVCRGVCVTLCCFALSFAPFLSLVYN